MPALAPIVINDGAATPVAHTFTPVTTNGSDAVSSNRAATILSGAEQLTTSVRAPQSPTASWKIEIGLVLPTVATVDGLDQVVRSSKSSLVINFAQSSTAAERKNMRVLLMNALANADLIKVIETPEPQY